MTILHRSARPLQGFEPELVEQLVQRTRALGVHVEVATEVRGIEKTGRGGLMPAMTIGQVARQAGVGVETVRFYERQGLLAEPPRRASGYRQYAQEVVARLR